MDRDEYLAGVTELYQGEVIGEGLFSCMLSTCAPEHRNAVAQLLQLESEAKIRLRPLLLRLGISIVEDESLRAAGVAFAKQLAEKPWREAMRSLGELSQPYLRRYKALEANAPAADLTDVSFMVAHEQAVVTFAELEALGQPEEALKPVVALLERPLPSAK